MLLLVTLLACEPAEYDISEKIYINEPEGQEEPGEEPSAQPEETAVEDECAEEEGTEFEDPNNLVGRADCGESVYFSNCAVCHGANGEGGNAGRQLSGRIDDMTDEYIMETILGGEGTMPPQNLTAQQTADVLAYLRSVM